MSNLAASVGKSLNFRFLSSSFVSSFLILVLVSYLKASAVGRSSNVGDSYSWPVRQVEVALFSQRSRAVLWGKSVQVASAPNPPGDSEAYKKLT